MHIQRTTDFAATIKTVKVEDGGDGSTLIEIEFSDGSTFFQNPDIPSCGSVLFTRQPDGAITEEEFYE